MEAIVIATHDGELASVAGGTPVASLPMLGQPLVRRTLDYLASQQVRSARIVLRHQPHLIEDHLADDPHPLVEARCVLEGRTQGSATVLKRVASGANGTVVVLWADMLCAIDLDAAFRFHKERQALVTAVLTDRRGRGPRFALDAEGRVSAIAEPHDPTWAGAPGPCDAGLYLIEPEALVHVPAGGCDLARGFLPHLVARNLPVYGYRTDAYWIDTGTAAGYWQAQQDVLAGRLPTVEAPQGVHVAPGASIDPSVKLAGPAWIGPGCKVDRDAIIDAGTVLEGGSRVRRGARLTGAVVLPGTHVGRATRWNDTVLAGAWVAPIDGEGPRIEPDADVLDDLRARDRGDLAHQLLDSALAAIGLLLLSPLLLLIALAIRLDSPGPAIYTQLRAGQRPRSRSGALRGRVFEIFKFRTMHTDADRRLEELKAQNAYGSGPFFKLDRDPRITRVGAFLRKTSLDELPQLLNVVRGEMRLVGNRPLPVYEAEALTEPWQKLRFVGPAGITGLWQISGRSDLGEDERMALDTCYSVTRTLWEDWRILVMTVPALLLRRGAR